MDKRELLKSVLQNFINDKPDEAKADFHQYLTLKSKEITGIGATPVAQETTEIKDTQTEPTETQTQVDPAVNDATQTATDDQATATAATATESQAQGTE
jgi:hypothetical protein